MFLNFFAYGKFGSHGRFAIYWISRNNGPRCIGSTVYLCYRQGAGQHLAKSRVTLVLDGVALLMVKVDLKGQMSIYNHYFSNFGKSPVPDDLCKDSAQRHPLF